MILLLILTELGYNVLEVLTLFIGGVGIGPILDVETLTEGPELTIGLDAPVVTIEDCSEPVYVLLLIMCPLSS